MLKTRFLFHNFYFCVIIYLHVNKSFQTNKVDSNIANSLKLRTIKLPFRCESNREFHCLHTEKCIDSTQICDRTFDCPDRSDEYNCNCKIDIIFYYSKLIS